MTSADHLSAPTPSKILGSRHGSSSHFALFLTHSPLLITLPRSQKIPEAVISSTYTRLSLTASKFTNTLFQSRVDCFFRSQYTRVLVFVYAPRESFFQKAAATSSSSTSSSLRHAPTATAVGEGGKAEKERERERERGFRGARFRSPLAICICI